MKEIFLRIMGPRDEWLPDGSRHWAFTGILEYDGNRIELQASMAPDGYPEMADKMRATLFEELMSRAAQR